MNEGKKEDSSSSSISLGAVAVAAHWRDVRNESDGS
jgi:hypothetical protein